MGVGGSGFSHHTTLHIIHLRSLSCFTLLYANTQQLAALLLHQLSPERVPSGRLCSAAHVVHHSRCVSPAYLPLYSAQQCLGTRLRSNTSYAVTGRGRTSRLGNTPPGMAATLAVPRAAHQQAKRSSRLEMSNFSAKFQPAAAPPALLDRQPARTPVHTQPGPNERSERAARWAAEFCVYTMLAGGGWRLERRRRAGRHTGRGRLARVRRRGCRAQREASHTL